MHDIHTAHSRKRHPAPALRLPARGACRRKYGIHHITAAILAFVLLLCISAQPALAEPTHSPASQAAAQPVPAITQAAAEPAAPPAEIQRLYENPDTGFCAWIHDEADLLTDEEEEMLLSDMKPLTEQCSAVFYSGRDRYARTLDYAEDVYRSFLGYESGVLFLIDMFHRELTIYADGDAYRYITSAKARSITDNVYSLARDGKYYECAAKAFAQANAVVNGSRIAEPMKYTSNLLIALCAGFLLTYLFVSRASRTVKPSREELLQSMGARFTLQNPRAQTGQSTRIYSPRVIAGGGGRGGSGGGGGHSGGGGSHGF